MEAGSTEAHVGTAALGRPAERSEARNSSSRANREAGFLSALCGRSP